MRQVEAERTGTSPLAFAAWVVALIVAVVAGLAVIGGLSRGSRAAGDPLLGRQAPALSGVTLTGDKLPRNRWRGHVTVVNIWASWCGPCRDELPTIAAFADHLAPRADVITVDTRDGPAAARSLLEEIHVHDLVAIQDPRGTIAVNWGATGVPETFVVAPNGVIRARVRGQVTASWLQEQVHRWQRS